MTQEIQKEVLMNYIMYIIHTGDTMNFKTEIFKSNRKFLFLFLC